MKTEEQTAIIRRWLNEYKGLVFKVVRANAFTPEDQEDLFQEISTQLWRSVPSFKKNSSEATWIYKTSLFCAMSWNRKEHRHRRLKLGWNESDGVTEFASENEDPRLAWLYEQIGLLSKLDRSLTLLILDGYSYGEMSSMLGISESSVGVRIHRIKKSLTEKSKNMEEEENGI